MEQLINYIALAIALTAIWATVNWIKYLIDKNPPQSPFLKGGSERSQIHHPTPKPK